MRMIMTDEYLGTLGTLRIFAADAMHHGYKLQVDLLLA